jgi:hypothetical protein
VLSLPSSDKGGQFYGREGSPLRGNWRQATALVP